MFTAIRGMAVCGLWRRRARILCENGDVGDTGHGLNIVGYIVKEGDFDPAKIVKQSQRPAEATLREAVPRAERGSVFENAQKAGVATAAPACHSPFAVRIAWACPDFMVILLSDAWAAPALLLIDAALI